MDLEERIAALDERVQDLELENKNMKDRMEDMDIWINKALYGSRGE